MTTTYNRSTLVSFSELSEEQKQEVMSNYNFEESDCYSTSFVIFDRKDGKEEALPLSMFMRANSNFTHGIYGTSAFDGYFITFDRCNSEAVIAHKYF